MTTPRYTELADLLATRLQPDYITVTETIAALRPPAATDGHSHHTTWKLISEPGTVWCITCQVHYRQTGVET